MIKIGLVAGGGFSLPHAVLGCLAFLSAASFAEPAANVHDAVIQAIESNPDLQASYHTFRAASFQVGEARSGYLPSLDLAATAGKGTRDFDGRDRYSNSQGQISLTQSLFEGFRTAGQVEHLEG